ncbi:MAG: FAD:protein FMN transferase [Deltaproteobacteria bacterium]|nr:FAD:protein FMN transferase [Deltaproteobacteria bacterium]
MKKTLLFLLLLCLAPQWANASPTQFYLEDVIGDNLKARIYVAADTTAQSQVQDALYRATDHAKATFAKLNVNNPDSEVSQINQKKTAGTFTLSAELAKAIETAQSVSKQTDGFFDITFNSPSGNYKSLKIDTKNNVLTIKENNVTIDLRYILSGFLADLIAEDLSNAGWKNALVKVDETYVANGNDISEPWKIPVLTPTNTIAKRALLYRSTDTAAATLGSKQLQDIINPKTKSAVTSDLKLVTIFTKGAAKAQGTSAGIYAMGREDGKIFLLRHSEFRGVFGDNTGTLTNIPEFK